MERSVEVSEDGLPSFERRVVDLNFIVEGGMAVDGALAGDDCTQGKDCECQEDECYFHGRIYFRIIITPMVAKCTIKD